MSTAAPPVAPPKHSPAEHLINERIEEARSALWWSELTRTTLKVLIGSMVALLAWLVMDHWIYSPGPAVRTLCLLVFLTASVWFLVRRAWPVITSRVTTEYAAWALEQDHPDFRQQLTSYVSLKPDSPDRGVRARVVKVIGSKAASLLKSHDSLPGEATGTFKWWIAAAGTFAILAAYCVGSPKSSLASTKRLVAPLAAIDPARRVQILDVLPGNAPALAGREVDVSADVDGLRDDEPVICLWSTDGPMQTTELVLDNNGDRHGGRIPLDHAASGVVQYTIEAGDAVAGPFELMVENVPVVAVENVRYSPPQYTKRKTRTTSSPAITGIEGTGVRITARTNRPVIRAELQFNPKTVGGRVRPTAGRVPIDIADDGVSLTSDIVLGGTRGIASAVELKSYQIRVWDTNDQSNPEPIVYPIKVITDLPPEVAIVVPQKSPIELPVNAQQTIEVHAMDADFELERVSLHIDRDNKSLHAPVIWVKPAGGTGKGNQVAEYRFRPTEHRLKPGDVVRIYASALDNREIASDPSVKPNESRTDPIEIRIVPAENELPEDPTENDGLSRPDDKPPSDVKESEQGDSGEQKSDAQGAEGSGSQGSEGQGSEGQGSEGQGSDSQGSDSQGSDSQGSDSQGSDSQGSDSQGSDSQGSDSQGGESQSPMSDDSQGGTQQSTDRESGGGTSSNSDSGTPENSARSDAQSGDPGDPQSQSESQSGSGDQQSRNSATGSDTGGRSQQSDDGASKSPPKHDGEAIERIKDYIEKQKREDGNGSASSSSDQQDAANDQQTGDGESTSEDSAEKNSDTQNREGSAGQQPADNRSGDESSSEPGNENSGQQDRGDQASSDGDMRDTQSGDRSQTGQQFDEDGQQNSGESQSSDNQENESSSSNQSQPSSKNQSPTGSPPSSSQSSSGDGADAGIPPPPPQQSDSTPPPPPDLEYAKKATDMVLDYLEETRDDVDEDLLKNLEWSREDLERFRQRWENVRKLDQAEPDPESSNQFEDALRSLGLQSDRSSSTTQRDSADSLRNIRDSGNRRKAPPAIRDAFEAFRGRN